MLPTYSDENVISAVVVGLRRRGLDVEPAQDRGQRGTDDAILLATATADGRLMLTNDTDFLRIHAEWSGAGSSHAGIVYWHQSMPIGEAIRRIVAYASTTTADAAANAVEFLSTPSRRKRGRTGRLGRSSGASRRRTADGSRSP